MRAGDTIYLTATVRTAAGAIVDGLASGTFTVASYFNGVLTALSVTITGYGGGTGRYLFAVQLPTTAGWLDIYVSNGSNIMDVRGWSGDIELQDLDTVYAVVAVPVVLSSAGAKVGATKDLTINARRRTLIAVTVTDQAGAAVDLSGYSNWRFTVWDKTHSGGSALYSLTTGITGSALGALAFTIPETAAFNSVIDTAIAAGEDTATVYFDVIADAGGVAASTDCIMRGQLVLTRWEGAA